MKKLARLGSLTLLLLAPLVPILVGTTTSLPRRRQPRLARRPDTVLLEELTWAEVRDLDARPARRPSIVGTAGTEQKGPHMVDGEHKFVME